MFLLPYQRQNKLVHKQQKNNEEFIKKSLVTRDEGMKAKTAIADQKNKEIIVSIELLIQHKVSSLITP